MQGVAPDVRAWLPGVNESTARAALDKAVACAERLVSSEIIERAIAAKLQQTAFPDGIHWVGYSIAQGYAGLALLCSQMDLCYPGVGWDLAGHEYLKIAGRDLEKADGLPLGIFSGLAGVAFATWQLSRQGSRYQRLLKTLDAAIVPRTLQLAAGFENRNGFPMSDFDAISGLAGIGAYLLCRAEDSAISPCLHTLLQQLTNLLLNPSDLPRWHTPPAFIRDEHMRQSYGEGWLNCGLAHGVPGPLATLSLAQLTGLHVPNMSEAIEQTAAWLCEHRFDDQYGVNWPTAIPLRRDEQTGILTPCDPRTAPDGPGRAAWCYGAPGVARALWLAGRAVGRADFCHLALSAMEAVFRRPVPRRYIDSPSFCHGVAGLLQITLRFANDLQDGRFSSSIDSLIQQILTVYSPAYPLGFRHVEIPGNEVDQAGFLDGAAGIAAVLLAAAIPTEPVWDRLFLLS